MEEINVLLIKTLHEIHMISYFIQKQNYTKLCSHHREQSYAGDAS